MFKRRRNENEENRHPASPAENAAAESAAADAAAADPATTDSAELDLRSVDAGPLSPLVAKREHSLSAILELLHDLNVTGDLYEIADTVLFNLMGHFGSARGALWLLPDGSSEDAVLVRCHGISKPVAKAVGTSLTKWLIDRLGVVAEPVLASSLKGVAATPGLDLALDNELALFAPVHVRGKFLGLVALGRRVGGDSFGVRDLDVLQASLTVLGATLENTSLFNNMAETNRQLRKANEKLQELDRLKSQFLSNTNHELRTPLTIISGYLDILQAETGLNDSVRENVEVIRGQTSRLQGLVLDLLDFSELLGEDFDVSLERLDLRPVLSSYHEERRPGVNADLREFKYSASSEAPHAIADRTRVIQILDALVDNALKFTHPGAHILLRIDAAARDDRTCCRIDLEDDGPGIPPDRLPHVFDTFVQGDGSDTRQYGGIGMGLSLARSLAEKMNGHLEVASEIGQGTTFSLYLPTD